MNPKVKLAAYAVLLILAVWFGLAFRYNYAAATSEVDTESSETAPSDATPPSGTNADASIAPTNGTTNLTLQATNVTADLTNATADVTNAATEATNNAAPGTNIVAATPPADHAKKKHHVKRTAAEVSSAKGSMVGYLGGLVVAVVALGLLIASDVTNYVGGQATDFLLMDVGDAMRDPIYERAEAAWANGTYLEAIQLLRDYLKRNPREIHAAIRIAEIYEKDVKNSLAAALEYEEVLKHKLPPERWGWAAIHLCNLYSKLNHHEKTKDLLNRIVTEYPKTAAAKKARARLGLAELEGEPEEPHVQTEDGPVVASAQETHAHEPAEPPPSSDAAKPNLPPGFRPK